MFLLITCGHDIARVVDFRFVLDEAITAARCVIRGAMKGGHIMTAVHGFTIRRELSKVLLTECDTQQTS